MTSFGQFELALDSYYVLYHISINVQGFFFLNEIRETFVTCPPLTNDNFYQNIYFFQQKGDGIPIFIIVEF
jgi:hypothetical protein